MTRAVIKTTLFIGLLSSLVSPCAGSEYLKEMKQPSLSSFVNALGSFQCALTRMQRSSSSSSSCTRNAKTTPTHIDMYFVNNLHEDTTYLYASALRLREVMDTLPCGLKRPEHNEVERAISTYLQSIFWEPYDTTSQVHTSKGPQVNDSWKKALTKRNALNVLFSTGFLNADSLFERDFLESDGDGTIFDTTESVTILQLATQDHPANFHPDIVRYPDMTLVPFLITAHALKIDTANYYGIDWARFLVGKACTTDLSSNSYFLGYLRQGLHKKPLHLPTASGVIKYVLDTVPNNAHEIECLTREAPKYIAIVNDAIEEIASIDIAKEWKDKDLATNIACSKAAHEALLRTLFADKEFFSQLLLKKQPEQPKVVTIQPKTFRFFNPWTWW